MPSFEHPYSVDTENSFFGHDVTYLPKKEIFPHPDNTLDNDILPL